MPKRFFWLMLQATLAAAQVVEGYVLNSVTGKGIGGARVDLTQGGDSYYTSRSDDQGHFLFDHVQNGTYRPFYSATEYFEIPFSGPTPQFQVIAGGNPVKLEVRLTPFSRLTGRVVRRDGAAVPGALLIMEGLQSVTSQRADDQGKFELRRFLLPGAYTLSAAPPADLKPPGPEPGSGRILNWTRTWYPGVTTRREASKITLAPGGEVTDLELKLLAVPAHAVRGVLLNPAGKPAAKTKLSLGEEVNLTRFTTETDSDGAFEFPAVVDGEWLLSAEVESGGVKLRAAHWFLMSGRELESVKLRLAAPFTVSGKMLVEAPKGAAEGVKAAPSRLPMVALSLHTGRMLRENDPDLISPLAMIGQGSPNARPDADGNLLFENVYPGIYRIVSLNAPAPYYLDTMRLGGAELTSPEVDISSGAAAVTLIYKTNGGAVRGTVENCASGGVMLIPAEPALRQEGFLRSSPCDPNNRYEITVVRPGEYYLLAIAGKPEPWRSARIDQASLTQAVSVTVRAGETTSADLRAILPN